MDNTGLPLRHGAAEEGHLAPELRWIENLTGAPTFTGMPSQSALDPHASSFSGRTRPYSLASQPPIEEIDESSFRSKVKGFFSSEINYIAENPQEYSPFVSIKAARTATLAGCYGNTRDDTVRARYFSYELGETCAGLLRTCAGLLRTEGGFSIKKEPWRHQFPGREHITSIVDLRVTHPLVENAGDILLEHQLRLDGERPLIMSRPALPEMEDRLEQMGFVDVGENRWVLDPTQHPDLWMKNNDGEWQRANKPGLYLSKSVSDDSDSEGSGDEYSSEAYIEDESSDDDPTWYLERYLNRLAIK
ncbi:host specificity protein [Mesorhizobium sp. L-2-11]|uniref:host specificity protein n=1 Tax=Mesorhizobium sp. L-2-11 TaxID=2744521 RepID=UPI001927D787|nr:host specificity protein [Mesorhizobium sp. L-2-11]BCH19466.1 host specificity protein [Mesorhizobium sp. L-2-11]